MDWLRDDESSREHTRKSVVVILSPLSLCLLFSSNVYCRWRGKISCTKKNFLVDFSYSKAVYTNYSFCQRISWKQASMMIPLFWLLGTHKKRTRHSLQFLFILLDIFFCFTIYLKKYKYVCLDWRSVYSIHGGDGGGGNTWSGTESNITYHSLLTLFISLFPYDKLTFALVMFFVNVEQISSWLDLTTWLSWLVVCVCIFGRMSDGGWFFGGGEKAAVMVVVFVWVSPDTRVFVWAKDDMLTWLCTFAAFTAYSHVCLLIMMMTMMIMTMTIVCRLNMCKVTVKLSVCIFLGEMGKKCILCKYREQLVC